MTLLSCSRVKRLSNTVKMRKKQLYKCMAMQLETMEKSKMLSRQFTAKI